MAENKKKGLEINETKGTFQLQGIVTGTEKDKFYVEKNTKNNKPMRMINFGVETQEGSTVYVSLNGMERDSVYFSKKVEKNGKKENEMKTIPWKDRFKFNEEGFKLLGVNVGVSKTKDDKGNDVNDKKVLTEYDACKEIGENLVDGKSVFVKGKIEYSKFEGKRTVKFIPTQISLCKDIDFSADDFVPKAAFTQLIVFTGITPNEDKTKFTVSAKVVGYNTVEDAEFVVLNNAIASNFKKNLKPYTTIKVWGHISVEKDTTEVEETDCWGDSNEMEKVNAPTVRELIITGADPTTIDKETYSEEVIEKAISKINSSKKAEKEFGETADNWGGSTELGGVEDDEEDVWG